MVTIHFSGKIFAENNQALSGVDIILVNLLERTHQYRTTTNETGNFSIELLPGIYDVLLNNSTHMPAIKAGVSIEQELVLNIVLQAAEPAGKRIIGKALLPDGTNAAGYTVELLSSDASKCLVKTNCAADGSFGFSDCEMGYHLLRLTDSSGKSNVAAMPIPGQSVTIQLILRDEHQEEAAISTILPQKEASVNYIFSVCKNTNYTLSFTGGLMIAGGKDHMETQAYPVPVILNIYTAKSSNPLYTYAVVVDTTRNPFYAMPPSSLYSFTDKTGDKYELTAYWPMPHTVSYNSSDPDIVRVWMGYGNYWPDAPVCS